MNFKPCKKCKEHDGYIVYEAIGIPCSCPYGKYKKVLMNKPRFYYMDLDNYTDDFLREIIQWQKEYIDIIDKFIEIKDKAK